jgi:acetylornithine deacetylase/succinyl-diaminopimelate desuccinylase-like protein
VKALEYARSNRHRFLAELKEFLSIPSVSTQEEHGPDVKRAAAWLRDKLLVAGFPRVDVMPTPGHPIVYAEWLAAGPDAPTILIYGHYDVQPPDPLELWDTPPFEPTIIGDDIFARGAADDKGQLYIHVKAVEAFKETSAAGAPPINVKAIFEGEEEIGSPSLEPFVHAHTDLLAADVAVISDTHILGKDTPSIVYALRGLAYLELEVTGPDHDLHSGAYGGAVHNPLNALCALIARLQDKDGHVTIPGFYDKVRQLDAEERAELARIPFERESWLRETGAPSDWGEPAYTIPERLTIRPTLDVNGIWGGYTQPGRKTVLPSKAFAKVSMRLVPDQDPAEIAQLFRNYVAEIAPPTVDVKVHGLQGGEAAIVDRSSPAMRAACRAYAAAFGKEPLFTREGGSIPIVPVLQKTLGIETILMGFGLPDDRLHSPNEKFHLPNLYKGVETVIHFMASLGNLENGQSPHHSRQ